MHRWLPILLFFSIAFNCIAIGYHFGLAPHKNTLSASLSTNDMSNVFKSLSPQDLAQIKSLMKRQQEEILSNQTQIINLRAQIANELMKESLNQTLLSDLFEKTYLLTSKNIALSQQTVYQTLIQLPLPQRVKVGKAMLQSIKKSVIIKVPLQNFT